MTDPTELATSGLIATIPVQEIQDALTRVIAAGLPIDDPETAGPLVRLKSIYARAVLPGEPTSRLHALNELLPRLIAGLADATYREAIQILFGLAPGTRGTNLTARRRQCADLLGYNPNYFRTQIEAKLLRAVAMALHEDLLRYASRTTRATTSLEATGQTPTLGPEHINHEEELISRIWQHVYGLRAETIAHIRLQDAGRVAEAEDHRQAAISRGETLQELLKEYADTYGEQLIRHGDAEISAASIARVATWHI